MKIRLNTVLLNDKSFNNYCDFNNQFIDKCYFPDGDILLLKCVSILQRLEGKCLLILRSIYFLDFQKDYQVHI